MTSHRNSQLTEEAVLMVLTDKTTRGVGVEKDNEKGDVRSNLAQHRIGRICALLFALAVASGMRHGAVLAFTA